MAKIDKAVDGYYTRRQRMEENGCKFWFHDDSGECPFCHTVFPKLLYADGNVYPVWERFAYCPQ